MAVPDPNPIIPTVAQVGALLRARTQDSHDDELGTFTDDTRPTEAEATELITAASGTIYNSVGDLSGLTCVNADLIRSNAQYMTSLLAACLIELSYFPEQVRSDRSPFQQYYDILTSEQLGMPALIDAVAECRGGEVEPDGEGQPQSASWAFPEDVGGLVGWQSRW